MNSGEGVCAGGWTLLGGRVTPVAGLALVHSKRRKAKKVCAGGMAAVARMDKALIDKDASHPGADLLSFLLSN